MTVAFIVNGGPVEVEVPPGEVLLDTLRGLGFRGVKDGCRASDCGSCAILLDGRPREYQSPSEASRLGIGMLYQDPLDFPPLTVLENFMIGQTAGLKNDERFFRKTFADLNDQFNFFLHPNDNVRSLTVGARQQLDGVGGAGEGEHDRVLVLLVLALLLPTAADAQRTIKPVEPRKKGTRVWNSGRSGQSTDRNNRTQQVRPGSSQKPTSGARNSRSSVKPRSAAAAM